MKVQWLVIVVVAQKQLLLFSSKIPVGTRIRFLIWIFCMMTLSKLKIAFVAVPR